MSTHIQTLPRQARVRWQRFRSLVSELGVRGALAFVCDRGGHRFGRSIYRLHPRHAVFPLHVRHGSSDTAVLGQVFVNLDYGPVCAMTDVNLVIDCGANVGYSSAFFLSHFGSCRLVAVEPDPGNFAMLERNLRQYGERVMLVPAGVWSHDVPLVISRGRYRDGREWTTQVRPCQPNERADVQGVGVESLLASSGCERISLLKMDIEGAESIVFRDDVAWLDKVDAIAIELHDDACFGQASDVVLRALRSRGFDVARSGDLTFAFSQLSPRHSDPGIGHDA